MAKQPAKGRKTPAKRSTAKPRATKAAEKVTEAEVVVDEVASEAQPAEAPAVEEQVTEVEAPQELTPEPETPKVEKPAQPPVLEPKQGGSAMPAVFGGLLAGAIGFGAAYFVLPQGDPTLAAKVSSQSSEISGLRDQVAAIPAPDLSGLETAQADTTAALTGLGDRITALEDRLDDLSSRAGEAGSVSAAAYEQELDALRAEMEELRGTAVAELGAARDAAASIEANAEAAARAAAGRAALARISGGLETGAPLGEALDDLAEAIQSDAPAELTAVRDGAPTLASLQAAFPEVARAALATARREGASGEPEGGFTAFLRNQLDVRSVAPKEGDGADAVLSRAEASLREGRLTDTLAELGALPEVARAELTEWQAMAEARADALAAAATLSTTLNDN